ncbi:MAG: family 2 glycosyl transferase [Flavobacteriaceae bacterium]|nr:family 2 glycosyl transferase [Flavobacteriaceae bacterium]
MQPAFKTYTNSDGEILLYVGEPDLALLEKLSHGPGDIWHSSFEQGYKNAFLDIVYQTVVFFWYVYDFDGLDECISWRLNPAAFAIRKGVWEQLPGFDADYANRDLQAFDFAYNALRNGGAIPLYVKGLYTAAEISVPHISVKDRYTFYRKNFKMAHSWYMLFRKGIWKPNEWRALYASKRAFAKRGEFPKVGPRPLNEVRGAPTVSYIIPTMLRQEYTLKLLEDLKNQSYLPSQVVVVDATPPETREESLYREQDYPFAVQFHWQATKGSCRARNEAIDRCTGDYIVFGDDDIRIPPDFIEGHLRLLQTYNAGACNGLDIRAENQQQDLDDLTEKLEDMDAHRWYVGAATSYSNANSCVKREYVTALVGNDINYDGGYGEDSDFGLSLTKLGVHVLHNPFSANLHLKPPAGGYRFWGSQAKLMGKKRKKQPWELDHPVRYIRPVPSPTIMYQLFKQFSARQRTEYRYKYFIRYLVKGAKWQLPLRMLKLPYRMLQYNKSVFYAKKLRALGKRTQ